MSTADILRPSHSVTAESSINPANSADQKRSEALAARTRIPMSVPRAKLATPEIPGYHCHWINDTPGRVLQAMQAGYTFVDKAEALITMPDLAGAPVGEGTDLGSRVSVVVGRQENETPLRAYLMKIPNEFYAADQRAHDERVDRVHEAMNRGQQQVDGESASDKAKRYVRGVSMKSTYSSRG